MCAEKVLSSKSVKIKQENEQKSRKRENVTEKYEG